MELSERSAKLERDRFSRSLNLHMWRNANVVSFHEFEEINKQTIRTTTPTIGEHEKNLNEFQKIGNVNIKNMIINILQ